MCMIVHEMRAARRPFPSWQTDKTADIRLDVLEFSRFFQYFRSLDSKNFRSPIQQLKTRETCTKFCKNYNILFTFF